jgi:hypothetical protein
MQTITIRVLEVLFSNVERMAKCNKWLCARQEFYNFTNYKQYKKYNFTKKY